MKSRRGHPARLAAALITVGLLAAGCAAGPEGPDGGDGEPQSGGSFIIALGGQPQGVDAALVNQVWRHIARALNDSLVFLNPETGEIEPWLATEWTVEEDRIYTFQLREDVTFNDGTRLTGEVVKANFDNLLGEGKHSSAKGVIEGVASITVPSEFSVRFEFAEPNAAFLSGLSKAHAGIVSLASAEAPNEERLRYIDGSGPFHLVSIVDNQEIVLEARDDYDWAPEYFDHEGPAYVDEVVYRIIPEASVRIGALQSDEVHFVYGVESQYFAELENAGIPLIQAFGQGTGTEWPVNTQSPILQDVLVRRALQKAIDREAIALVGTGGTDLPARGPLTEANPYFVDLSEELAYDPEGAIALLEEAGWTEIGSDGIRVKDGQRLSLTFPGADTRDETLIIQDQFRQVGIELVIDPPLAAEANEALLSGRYDLGYWTHSFPDPDDLRANYGFTTGSNRSFLTESNELDQLLQQQRVVLDRAERQGLIDRIARILVEDAYTLPILQDVDVWATSPRVHGLKANGVDQLLYDVWLESAE